MHLVFNHVAKLEHVGHTHSSLLVEALAGATVVEPSLAHARQASLIGPLVKVVERCSIKDRSSKLNIKFTTSPS